MSEESLGRVPSAPGSCPDGLSPSVSGHSPCDPSRTHWQPILTAPKDRKTVLLIACYPYGSGGWSDPWAGWWDGRSWTRWPHAFDPEYWAPITMPEPVPVDITFKISTTENAA